MNLFNFEYEVERQKNRVGSESAFSLVYGQEGKIVHAKKDSFTVISTESVSNLGHAFIDKGFNVTPFTHKDGGIIGLNIALTNNRQTSVGTKNYSAIITIPNNASVRGFLAVKEKRIICSNMLTISKVLHKEKSVKIPHNLSYEYSIKLMKESLESFKELLEFQESFDKSLSGESIDKYEAMRMLNYWFYHYEMPISHRSNMSFADFRKALVVNTEGIKSYKRYEQLKDAFNNELQNNSKLNLNLSTYTVFASVTNYLSRRQENSNSKACDEIQGLRSEKKLEMFYE